MISVHDAKAIIKKQISSLGSIQLNLDDAIGYVVSEDIISPIDVPSFVQSSMDGYAFAFDDLRDTQSLTIAYTVQAGDANLFKLSSKQAVRIFTGAPLPVGADTVLMQEKAKVQGDQLHVLDDTLQKGAHARNVGADIRKGAIAVKRATLLTPGAIGFLASLGITQVWVTQKPTVNIIVTGNELQDIDKPLTPAKIYESNSHTLKAGLKAFGINDLTIQKVADELDAVAACLKDSLAHYDLTIVTGGISVGDFDFVLAACQQNEVEQLFHKVKQKPGKPLYIGKKGDKVVCALPGNPASVLSCFYNYVSIVLDQLSNSQTEMKMVQATLTNAYKKPLGFTQFLKGRFNYATNEVVILEGQESFMMNPFVIANCFVEIPESLTEVNPNQLANVHLFKLS